jgi:hypothetical protein
VDLKNIIKEKVLTDKKVDKNQLYDLVDELIKQNIQEEEIIEKIKEFTLPDASEIFSLLQFMKNNLDEDLMNEFIKSCNYAYYIVFEKLIKENKLSKEQLIALSSIKDHYVYELKNNIIVLLSEGIKNGLTMEQINVAINYYNHAEVRHPNDLLESIQKILNGFYNKLSVEEVKMYAGNDNSLNTFLNTSQLNFIYNELIKNETPLDNLKIIAHPKYESYTMEHIIKYIKSNPNIEVLKMVDDITDKMIDINKSNHNDSDYVPYKDDNNKVSIYKFNAIKDTLGVHTEEFKALFFNFYFNQLTKLENYTLENDLLKFIAETKLPSKTLMDFVNNMKNNLNDDSAFDYVQTIKFCMFLTKQNKFQDLIIKTLTDIKENEKIANKIVKLFHGG